jgi:hypothetical protein
VPERFGSGRELIAHSEALHLELLLAVERLDTFVGELRCEARRRDTSRNPATITETRHDRPQ